MIPRLSRTPRHLRSDDRGAALLEFAIVVPVLLLLVFGIIDYGRYFAQYGQKLAAARDGARLAAVRPTSTAAQVTQLNSEVRALVLARASTPALTAAMINIEAVSVAGVRTMQVRIEPMPFTKSVPLVPVPRAIPAIVAGFRHEYN